MLKTETCYCSTDRYINLTMIKTTLRDLMSSADDAESLKHRHLHYHICITYNFVRTFVSLLNSFFLEEWGRFLILTSVT